MEETSLINNIKNVHLNFFFEKISTALTFSCFPTQKWIGIVFFLRVHFESKFNFLWEENSTFRYAEFSRRKTRKISLEAPTCGAPMWHSDSLGGSLSFWSSAPWSHESSSHTSHFSRQNFTPAANVCAICYALKGKWVYLGLPYFCSLFWNYE